MEKELIQEILDYVEDAEEKIDSHWGNRTFKELLAENDVPDFYLKLKKLLDE